MHWFEKLHTELQGLVCALGATATAAQTAARSLELAMDTCTCGACRRHEGTVLDEEEGEALCRRALQTLYALLCAHKQASPLPPLRTQLGLSTPPVLPVTCSTTNQLSNVLEELHASLQAAAQPASACQGHAHSSAADCCM